MQSLALLAALVLPAATGQILTDPRSDLDGETRTEVSIDVPTADVARRLSPGTRGPGAAGVPKGGSACGAPSAVLLDSGVAPEGDGPVAVAFTPDAARLVVAHRASRNLIVFDANTLAFQAAIDVSGSPQALAITPDGTRAVVANLFEDTVSIVDLALGLELATVAVGDQPGIVRITPDGTRAVVANTVSQSVSVVDIASATEVLEIGGAGFSASLTLTGEGGVVTAGFYSLEVVDDTTAIAPDFTNDEIDFFDLAAGTVTSIACPPRPRGLAVTFDGSTAVVSHVFSEQKLSVVDTATRTISKTIATGISLDRFVGVHPDAARAIVAVSNGAVVVDLATDAVSPVLSTGFLTGIGTTADGQRALCYGFQGALVDYATQSILGSLNGTKTAWEGAVSPTGDRGAMLVNHNAEDVVVADTSGSGATLGVIPTGPAPEADSPRKTAVSPDGSLAVTTNILSDTATVTDLATGVVVAVLPVGDRPADVEITPDGTKAVVANLDSTFASVIDLASLTVTNVPISTRGAEVEIAPDGSYAYVSVVVADGVWRIDLATDSVAGPKLATGDMGSVFYFYQQMSGLELSPDGTTLATCDTYTDTVTLIDTASWSVLATVPVGDFPARAAFSPDGARLYVANKNDDAVGVVDVPNAVLVQTIAVGDAPFEMAVAPAGDRLYVLETGAAKTVGVVDLALGLRIAGVATAATPQALALDSTGSCLAVASGTWTSSIGPGPKIGVDLDGHHEVIDTQSLTVAASAQTGVPPADLAFDACGAVALAPTPNTDDLARIALFEPDSAVYGCGVNPAGSLVLLGGGPVLGTTLVLGVDDPLGAQPSGSLSFVFVAVAPDPAFPCGTVVPGLGMGGGGAPGELLLSLAPPNPVATAAGPVWSGAGSPAPVAVPIPSSCGLAGLTVFAQGALVDAVGPGLAVGLTEGRTLALGL